MPTQEFTLPTVTSLPQGFKIERPKKMYYVKTGLKIINILEFLESSRGPILSQTSKIQISNCLAYSLQNAFQGNFHISRNYLAIAINHLTTAHNKILPLKKPINITLTSLNNLNYMDLNKNIDL